MSWHYLQAQEVAYEQLTAVFCMLIFPVRVLASMFRITQAFKVFDAVVGFVTIPVVYIVTIRDCTDVVPPDITVQKISVAVRSSIVAFIHQGILIVAKNNKRNPTLRPHLEIAQGKHFIDRLAGHAKRSSHFGKTESPTVQGVHRIDFFVFTFCWHNNSPNIQSVQKGDNCQPFSGGLLCHG